MPNDPTDDPTAAPPTGHRLRHAPPRPHASIRTFQPRGTPMGPERHRALETLWPVFGFAVAGTDPTSTPPARPDGALDTAALFGRSAPVVLEIGSGMGEGIAAMAAADPRRDYLAVEAHEPGIAALLLRIERAGLTNVRVAHGDALDLVRERIAADSLDAVHVFFPDPWPKNRHHKRRIIQPDHVALLRSRLAPGGLLHCATDWAPYAKVMLDVLSADPELVNTHPGFAPRPPHRPVTKFEQRGLDLGHEIFDLVFRRADASHD